MRSCSGYYNPRWTIWTKDDKATKRSTRHIEGQHYPFDRHDPDRTCLACGGPIKARIVKLKKQRPVYCYKCYCRQKGKLTGQQRRKLRHEEQRNAQKRQAGG